jgi:uncharacterized protein
MGFLCQMCGQCCSTMGEIISIREKTREDEFRIEYSATGETRLVTLDPDKKTLFFSKESKTTIACPFLREQKPGRSVCSVHSSRPELCRQYSCFRILILDADGRKAGRVIDKTRYFTTTNPRLHEIWIRECSPLEIPDDELWEEEIRKILTRAGYCVIK